MSTGFRGNLIFLIISCFWKKYFAFRGPLVSPAVTVYGWCKVASDLDPTPVRIILIGPQVCKWVQIYIFRLFYKLTSNDLWPWYVTFDLINKWGFPCCIYDPNLVEIHQSMWKIEPNVKLFSKQQTTDNNRQQPTKWSLCVFPAKAGDTKMELHNKLHFASRISMIIAKKLH